MNKPLCVIVGQTATGKTDLALKLAQKFNGEIICADSWTVRRRVNIGTAKPNLEQKALVVHHMIDLIDPCEDYTAARYKTEALRSIDEVYNKDKLPFLVGGTGLYIDSIIFDYSFLPAASKETRDKLNALNLSELHLLAEAKQLSLQQIDPRNKRRVIRLIETNGRVAARKALRNNTLIVGLAGEPEEIKQKIEIRVEAMIGAGLEEEVKLLSLDLGWDCEALKGIGYNEWKEYFLGTQSLEVTKQRIIKNTIALAKRQITWFQRNKSIHWYSTPVDYLVVEELLTTFLNKNIYIS